MPPPSSVPDLLSEIRACTICAASLPLGPRPVVSFSEQSRILIIGQAPGTRVHESGIPWDDPSGDRLRDWLGISSETFYDPNQIGILPMGFCYPGKGKSGDLPPRPECAPQWHERVLTLLQEVQLTLLIGQYAQAAYLGRDRERTLTATVQHFNHYLPAFLPLPHPSPRNNIWLRKNPWFAEQLLPVLREKVRIALT